MKSVFQHQSHVYKRNAYRIKTIKNNTFCLLETCVLENVNQMHPQLETIFQFKELSAL